MSLKAITWVLYEAPVTTQSHLLVLLALADRANDDGTAAFPGREWIGERARCSVRSVASHLRALEDAGLIRKGDQELVSHFRSDRRPVVYDLVMTAGNSRTPSVDDVQSDASRGARSGTHDVQPVAHKPSFFSYGEETVLNTSNAREIGDRVFESSWTHWPRSDRKKNAREKFHRLVSNGHDVTNLGYLIRQYGDAYSRTTDPQFVPHLVTWLNQERWNDPLPAPRADRGQQRQNDAMALIARMAEEDQREQAGNGATAGVDAGRGRPGTQRAVGAGLASGRG